MCLIKNDFKILQTDPTLQHNKMVNDTINQFKNKNLLSKEAAEELKVINPKIPKFHIAPKVHKNQGNLSTVNCKISEISHILTLTISFLAQTFIFKSKVVLWEQYALLHAQTYSCPSSKIDASSSAILRKT